MTGFRILEDEFPGGDANPIEVAVQADEPMLTDGALDPAWVTELGAYVDDLAALDSVTEVTSVLDPPAGMDEATYLQLISLPADQRPPEAAGIATWIDQWIADDLTRVNVFSSALPDSAEGRAVVDSVRAVPVPDGAADTLTAGLSSRSHDFMASFTHSWPFALAIVVGVTAIVLFLTFGSILLPIKAVLMSLLSITASFGALVWIFQDGNLGGLLGVDPSGTIIASTPDPHVRHPLRPLDGLRGLPALPHPRALSSRRATTPAPWRRGSGSPAASSPAPRSIMVAVFGAFALSSVVADQVARLQHGAGRPDRRDPRPRRARAGLHARDGLGELVGAALGPAWSRPNRALRGRTGARRRLIRPAVVR